MLERTLSRRSALEHGASALAGATGLGIADSTAGDDEKALDATDPDDCGPDHVAPDVAVIGARRPEDSDQDGSDGEVGGVDADYVVRAGEAVTFDASETESAAPVAAFEWDFGRETATGGRVHHAWERGGGVATVELTVRDRAGRSASVHVEIAVESPDRHNRAPTPVHDVSPTRTYDDGYVAQLGETLTFDARDSRDPDGDVVGYEWAFRRGAKEGAVVEHAFRREGNYEVTLTVTDDDGVSESIRVPIHVTR